MCPQVPFYLTGASAMMMGADKLCSFKMVQTVGGYNVLLNGISSSFVGN